jgi:tetratricopeptide (TPR) repeat protein
LLAQDISTGVKLIKSEKLNEAKTYFTSLLNSKAAADAHFYLGQIYFDEGNIDSAHVQYAEGLKIDPDNALCYAGVSKVMFYLGNNDEGEKRLNTALDKGDDNALTYVTLAEAFSNSKVKNYDRAITLLNNSLSLKKKDINSYISLGKVYLAKGNGTDAIKNFSAALDMDSKNSEALTQKAKVYVLISNNEEGINLLNEAITNDPNYAPAYNELAEVYAGMKDYPKAAENYAKYIEKSESTVEREKRFAQILYVNKEYQKAIDILKNVITKESDISSSSRIIAYSYLRLDEAENSKIYFEKLFSLKNVEFQPADYENYGDLLSKTGNDSLALVYYEKIVSADKTRKDIYGRMSVINFKNKNWAGVVSALENKGTLTAQEYFDLGKAYMFLGDKAVSEVTESLNSNITLTDDQKWEVVRPSLLYYQGDLRNANGDQVKIDEALNKVSATVDASIAKEQKSKWNTVKTSWIQAVKDKIKLDYAKADTALTMLTQKVPDLAVAYFWKARVNTNFDPESKSGLAKPYYEQFIEKAVNDKDKFKKELIESYQYLGYFYYLQEDNEKSKVYWQEVLNLDPENKQATDVLKMLK